MVCIYTVLNNIKGITTTMVCHTGQFKNTKYKYILISMAVLQDSRFDNCSQLFYVGNIFACNTYFYRQFRGNNKYLVRA